MDNEKNLQPINLQLVPADYKQDETTLYDIWHVLVEFKYHIIAITLICTFVALVYAMLLPPVYESETRLLPPDLSDIIGLNVTEKKYLPTEVFQTYVGRLTSYSIRRQFLEKNHLLVDKNDTDISNKEVFQNFNKSLSVNDEGNIVIVRLTAPDAEFTAKWNNKFVEFVDHVTVESLKMSLTSELAKKKNAVFEEINLKRESAIKKMNDNKAVLEEALSTAEKLNLEEPFIVSNTPLVFYNPDSSQSPVNFQQSPLYMRGTVLLSEELQTLQNRKNVEPFIQGLRELEEQAVRYETLLKQIDEDESITLVRVDQRAWVPEQRIKPKRKLIVITGLILGLIIGILVVFILTFIRNARELTARE